MGDRIEFCPYEDASFQDAAYQGIKIPVNFVTSLLTGKCVEGPIDYLETNLDKVPQDVTISQQVMSNLYQALMGSNEFWHVD